MREIDRHDPHADFLLEIEPDRAEGGLIDAVSGGEQDFRAIQRLDALAADTGIAAVGERGADGGDRHAELMGQGGDPLMNRGRIALDPNHECPARISLAVGSQRLRGLADPESFIEQPVSEAGAGLRLVAEHVCRLGPGRGANLGQLAVNRDRIAGDRRRVLGPPGVETQREWQ